MLHGGGKLLRPPDEQVEQGDRDAGSQEGDAPGAVEEGHAFAVELKDVVAHGVLLISGGDLRQAAAVEQQEERRIERAPLSSAGADQGSSAGELAIDGDAVLVELVGHAAQ